MGTFRKAKITTSVVERLSPEATVIDTDLSGFGVRCQGEKRVYFIRKYAYGRLHYLTIGEHGREGWTEARARREALLIIASLQQGRDPAAERAKARGMPSLAEYAREFVDHQSGKLKPGTIANYRSLLATHIAPRDHRGALRSGCLGQLRLDTVTHQDVAGLHRLLRETPRAANHVLAFISSVYSGAQAAGLVPAGFNPARRVKHYPIQPRQRYLTDEELARVGQVLEKALRDGTDDAYAIAALRLLILTGCRRNEILAAKWCWVDFERNLLNLPDSKTGSKPVYLCPPAMDVLRRLPRVEGNPYVIVGIKAGQRWVNLRKVWVRVRDRAGLAPTLLPNGTVQHVRLHDLRHSYASLLASGGASLPMIGKLMGHSNPQTTARYAHLADDPLRRLADGVGEIARAKLGRDA